MKSALTVMIACGPVPWEIWQRLCNTWGQFANRWNKTQVPHEARRPLRLTSGVEREEFHNQAVLGNPPHLSPPTQTLVPEPSPSYLAPEGRCWPGTRLAPCCGRLDPEVIPLINSLKCGNSHLNTASPFPKCFPIHSLTDFSNSPVGRLKGCFPCFTEYLERLCDCPQYPSLCPWERPTRAQSC